MRGVTGHASLDLHRRVLVYKRSGFVGMAFEANQILRCCGPQLPGLKPAMRVMAIIALHHPFIDSVMEGARELLFCFQMAAVAELRLLLFHEKLAFLRMVR